LFESSGVAYMQRIATMSLEVPGDFAAEPHEFVNIRLASGAYIRPVDNTLEDHI
jgi:hypothetical protein